MNNIIQKVSFWGRYLLQLPSKYVQNDLPHIFLFSTRRSGSTLLRDLVYSQPGFNYIDQTFNAIIYNHYSYLFPQKKNGHYVELNSEESILVKKTLFSRA